jgi:DNA-directed RNA polymerase specialized sigma24 family protein
VRRPRPAGQQGDRGSRERRDRGLSEDLRQAITLREIEGLSYEEISDVMNCPIGTVRSRIFRAREAIAAAAAAAGHPRG